MIGNKSVTPTSTVTPARVRLFQATQRPTRINARIETPWGWCRVNGRLGQRHADLLESIMYSAEGRRNTDDGSIELLVDPARVRSTLSDARYSLQQIRVLIDDLRGAVVEIYTSQIHVLGGLLDHIIPTEETHSNPLPGGAPRHLWTVRLGLPLVKLLEVDLALHYDPAPLARLQYGISQSIGRHVLTHKVQPNGGWTIDGLIRAVAGNITSDALRKARARVREDAPGLASAGIRVEVGRVYRAAGRLFKTGSSTSSTVPHPPGDAVPVTEKRATAAR